MSKTVITCGIDTGILLEAGTNELEILVLRAGDSLFGVNVAKVREVLTIDRPTRLPQSHVSVEGTVQIRGQVVELVNLVQFLFGEDSELSKPRPTDKMVVMEFNQDLIAFRLNGVEQIFRTSWNTVQPMPHIRGHKAPVTGIVLREGKLIQMLDFEAIGAQVGMSRHVAPKMDDHQASVHADLPIIFAEDSPLITEMLHDTLRQAGYRNVTGFVDGQAAWNHLQQVASQGPADQLRQRVGVLVSDVEMPRMDGLTLTRKIRDNPLLASLPVVIFSSIVSRDNAKKGQQVGADAQVAKPRYAELATTLERLLAEKYPVALAV